jgi:hypothetical protein
MQYGKNENENNDDNDDDDVLYYSVQNDCLRADLPSVGCHLSFLHPSTGPSKLWRRSARHINLWVGEMNSVSVACTGPLRKSLLRAYLEKGLYSVRRRTHLFVRTRLPAGIFVNLQRWR